MLFIRSIPMLAWAMMMGMFAFAGLGFADPGPGGAFSDPSVREFVHRYTRSALSVSESARPSGGESANAPEVAEAVLRESHRYRFDPLLILAVIQNESRFRPWARGRHGEIGLMQLKPATGRWVARLYGFSWEGNRTLWNPGQNIRIGTAYLSLLRGEFVVSRKSRYDVQTLYLAAYNGGIHSVHRAIQRNALRKD